jgi:tetratricopeptide (TPR) repeat protein
VGLFDSEARRERRLQGLQDTSNKHAEQALLLWQSGRVDEALRLNRRALDVIEELRALEPDNEEHLAQLAGKLYNHAGMLSQARRFPEAAVTARACLDRYLELTGGEVSPDAIRTERLLGLAHSLRPAPPRRHTIEKLAAMTADAKGRLAWLLALGLGSVEESRRLVAEAVSTYNVLVQLDRAYGPDLARVQDQYTLVQRLTGERST